MTHSTFIDLPTFDERRRGKSPDVWTRKKSCNNISACRRAPADEEEGTGKSTDQETSCNELMRCWGHIDKEARCKFVSGESKKLRRGG